MDGDDRCFVVMPFRDELHFFYLYLRDYLSRSWGIEVERGDTDILTREVLGKIQWQIKRADFVIADITAGNPNVFYEIGFAQAMAKPVIFLSRDSPESSPFDVRGFDIILYSLRDDRGLTSRLDNAVYNIFKPKYEGISREAVKLFERFCVYSRRRDLKASPEKFLARVMRGKDRLPPVTEVAKYAEFLVPRVLDDTSDIDIVRLIEEWARSL